MLSSPAHGICSLDVSAHIQFLSSVNQDLGEKKRKQLSTLLSCVTKNSHVTQDQKWYHVQIGKYFLSAAPIPYECKCALC